MGKVNSNVVSNYVHVLAGLAMLLINIIFAFINFMNFLFFFNLLLSLFALAVNFRCLACFCTLCMHYLIYSFKRLLTNSSWDYDRRENNRSNLKTV